MARTGPALVRAALVLVTFGLGLGSATAGEEKVSSGPPVGASAKPFNVQAVTGPHKGQRLCYI